MIPNSNPISFITFSLGLASFILILLLPSILELKKPKDPGPKNIESLLSASSNKESVLTNLEENQNFDGELIKKTANVLNLLPNLEV